MMQEQDLHELAEFVSEDAPVLSLYLNIDRRNRSTDEHKAVLRQLLTQAAEQGAAPADVARIERFFEHEYDRQGRAVACFACGARKFWRGYTLPVPARSTVFVGRRPYVKPLSDIWDNYERFGVLMVDREGARVLVYQLGALEEAGGTLGAEVRRHKQGGWAAQKLQRYEDQEAKNNLKEAAEWAADYLAQRKVTRVVLSGTDGNLAEFRDLLPGSLAAKVVGQTTLDLSASSVDAWEQAFKVAQEAQQQAEVALLEEVITSSRKGGTAVTGVSDTLTAMHQGRVHQLLVDPDLHVPGRQCTGCGAVAIEELAACPYCGGALVASTDVVNLLVHRAIDAGLKVSALDHNARLAEVGGIAAVLRY